MYGTERKRIATGLSIEAENLATVEAKAHQMHLDILAEHFDVSLARYGLAKPELTLVTPKVVQIYQDKYRSFLAYADW